MKKRRTRAQWLRILKSNKYTTQAGLARKLNVSHQMVFHYSHLLDVPLLRSKTKQKYSNIEDYFDSVIKTGKESNATLQMFIRMEKCEVCGSIKRLHIHHLKYPAIRIQDLEVLCSSCHCSKHRKNILPDIKAAIKTERKNGASIAFLCEKYSLSNGRISQITNGRRKRKLVHENGKSYWR
jgi:hypothetical protein